MISLHVQDCRILRELPDNELLVLAIEECESCC